MRKFVLRLAALAGVVLTVGACADSPTAGDHQRAPDLAASALDTQVEGCVTEGTCALEPISGGGCDEWDYSCDDGGGDCAASSTSPSSPEGTTVQGCDDGGGDGGDYDGGGGGSSGGGGDGGTKDGPTCPDGDCNPPPACDPRTDPGCEQPLTAGDSTTITAALAGYVRPASEIPDTTARRQCAEMLAQFNASYAAGDVFRGGSNTTHYGAMYNDRIHFDPQYLDAAASGNAAARREIANTALHEAAHVLGYDHPTAPTWVGNQDYYSDVPFNLLSPGTNSCIRY